MSKKNRTILEFQENIDTDFIKRRDELKIIKGLSEKKSKSLNEVLFAKNLIVFLYAHWEGFIKYASECFLQFLSHKNFKYKQLGYGLLAISSLEQIKDFVESNVTLKIKAIEYLFGNLESKAVIPYDYTIATY